MSSDRYYNREEVYSEIYKLIEEAKTITEEPFFEVILANPKKKLNFEEDFPEKIVEKLLYTSIHSDIDHEARQFNIGEAWIKLELSEIKEFINTLLKNYDWFTVIYDNKELSFIQYNFNPTS